MIIRLVGQGPCLLLGQCSYKHISRKLIQVTGYSVYTSLMIAIGFTTVQSDTNDKGISLKYDSPFIIVIHPALLGLKAIGMHPSANVTCDNTQALPLVKSSNELLLRLPYY